MKQETIDEKYMRRCLQLAANGQHSVVPNPMVGAVIVSQDGRILGEGYHRKYGEAHAEVNAFAAVSGEDECLLGKATLYVNLEPCSHHGKTPPCCDLIIKKKVHRVVCGMVDPFSKVQGRGIERIRKAGIEVRVGVLEKECRQLNRKFIVCNIEQRPYIILKWAQTTNGVIGYKNTSINELKTKVLQSKQTIQEGLDQLRDKKVLKISTPFTQILVHKLRSENDAIIVGMQTYLAENPKLDVRKWYGRSPQKIVLTNDERWIEGYSHLMPSDVEFVNMSCLRTEVFKKMNDRKIYTLLVEGGRATLQSFLEAGLWDEIRVETSSEVIDTAVLAPSLPNNCEIIEEVEWDNKIVSYLRIF